MLSVHDHDPEAFTQGLLLANGVLYESTGQYGRSDVRKVDPQTGRVLDKRSLPDGFFGEGLALVAGTLYQLTWRERTAFLYDAATLRPTGRIAYRGEGWGLAWDGRRFLMSDGGDQITTRSREFQVQSEITVRSDKGP
ncbi:MAG: glutaminyl-peptide cyclotransferase, partial [Oceanidesulfovibrio sp.]